MSKLPSRFLKFKDDYPDMFSAYECLGESATEAGPLDPKQIALIKIGIALGAKLEGAVHSHCRKALGIGLKTEEIRHAVLLAVTTLGFPSMMAGLSWVDDVINAQKSE